MKKGQRVKVIKRYLNSQNKSEYGIYWQSDMDNFNGEIVTIKEIGDNFVKIKETYWSFDKDWLELIPLTNIEVGDVIIDSVGIEYEIKEIGEFIAHVLPSNGKIEHENIKDIEKHLKSGEWKIKGKEEESLDKHIEELQDLDNQLDDINEAEFNAYIDPRKKCLICGNMFGLIRDDGLCPFCSKKETNRFRISK